MFTLHLHLKFSENNTFCIQFKIIYNKYVVCIDNFKMY